ncbi:hypothetical protein [Streptomyces sp. NPDC057854]|uniref:hypothetical protein n=1 Tax=unclassified Streptomyces TaxID=2593676 RepID=UPI00369616C0
MRDVLALGVLGLLLVGAGTVAVAVVCATVTAARAVRALAGLRRRPLRTGPRPAAALLPGVRPFVWLQCDAVRCAHLQTPHYPAGPGYVSCSGCGARRPSPAPSP